MVFSTLILTTCDSKTSLLLVWRTHSRSGLSNVERWKSLNPDFEIIEWNEDNIDVSGFEFGRRCLEQKKWGFLGDVVRLQALVEQGGFYLDCDIELFKPLSLLSVDHRFALGYMYDCALAPPFSMPLHVILFVWNC